jgi:hypothetical protein
VDSLEGLLNSKPQDWEVVKTSSDVEVGLVWMLGSRQQLGGDSWLQTTS